MPDRSADYHYVTSDMDWNSGCHYIASMHILLGFLTTLVTALFLLDRLGVDIGGLNPFSWHRRRQWRKKYYTLPVHQLKRPIEGATVLLVGAVQSEGLVSREQKNEILDIFMEEFRLSRADADEYFVSANFLLKDIVDVSSEVHHILAPIKSLFTETQSRALIEMLKKVSELEGEVTATQQKIIQAVKHELLGDRMSPGAW